LKKIHEGKGKKLMTVVDFKCGEWEENPLKGQMTPRKHFGWIFDNNGVVWEVLYWEVEGKNAAAQFHISENLSVGRKVFWPTREEAIDWHDNPVGPTIEEIKMALARCTWHEPSRGLIQVWIDIKRNNK
jgi:hypothetical protein